MKASTSLSITNIVITYSLPFHINLRSLKDIYQNADYRPERFNGAIVKRKNNCMLIFRNGKVNIVGNKSRSDADEALCDLCTRLGQKWNQMTGKVVNMVGTCSLGHSVALNTLARDGTFEYNSEIYPAAYYSVGRSKISVFHTGKMIFTGFLNEKDMYDAYNEVNLLIKFLID